MRAAAEALNTTPSAISKQINTLEQGLGRTLFVRTKRGAVPSQDGKLLQNFAKRFVMLAEELGEELGVETAVGTVRLGVNEDAGFARTPVLLKRCASLLPRVQIELMVAAPSALISCINQQTLDLAIISSGGVKNIPKNSVSLGTERLVWAAAPGGNCHHERPLPVSVAGEDCQWRELALAALDRNGIDAKIMCTSYSTSGQLSAVKANLAIAAVPETVLSDDYEIIGEEEGLPALPPCELALVVKKAPNKTTLELARQIEQVFA